ncbi:hypothetical protein AURDEDRAFT_121189 [Auricularia subglabra TFB-10046 SS5]|nr:hypothetical protein AURDEDRAFT_121189 [Auricularia subglabra TFB-10046 SS5]
MSKDSNVQIVNGTRGTLTLKGTQDVEGYFTEWPSKTLAPGRTTTVKMSKNFGLLGSGGLVYYTSADGAVINISFGCPQSADNYAREGVDKSTVKDAQPELGPFSQSSSQLWSPAPE